MNREQTRKLERGTRNNADRLRALNVQQQVKLDLDDGGVPVVVTRETGDGKRVASIGGTWRIDSEWWRLPIVRRYVEVILEGGGRVVLFEDLSTGEWWIQKPAWTFRVPTSAFQLPCTSSSTATPLSRSSTAPRSPSSSRSPRRSSATPCSRSPTTTACTARWRSRKKRNSSASRRSPARS